MTLAPSRRAALIGALAAAPSAALARSAWAGKVEPTAPKLDATSATKEETRLGLYAPLLSRLRAAALAGDEVAAQMLTQFCASVGDEAGALASETTARSKPAFPTDTVRIAPALDAIAAKAKGRRIVILNEAHHVSRCRAFGHAVALRLRQEGFDLFAAETFTNPGANPGEALARLNAGGPVTWNAGYYLRDPVFAEMVRGAREAGFQFAAYEQRKDQEPAGLTGRATIPPREIAEAENLAAVLKARPTARVLIYCGYSHAAKTVQANGEAWMAARLPALTGLDPLTINQSSGWPGPDRAHEREGVTRVLDRFNPTQPVSLTQAGGGPWVFGYPDTSFDIQIVHPRLPDVDERPGWLAVAPGRRRVAVALPPGLPAGALVQAVRRDELARAANTIPSDQYPLAAPDTRRAVLYLRPGAYTVRVETPKGRRALQTADV